jgi:hypothetical protein
MTTDDPSTRPKPQNITLAVEPAQVNLTCHLFHVWAEDFLLAEKLYAPSARTGSHVAHFLCCQSIELSLKAFLSLKGMNRRELKKLGHNLDQLFGRARSEGLSQLVPLQPRDQSIVQAANAWYDTPGGKRFQYFGLLDAIKGFKGSPDLAGLEELAGRLQSKELREAVSRP